MFQKSLLKNFIKSFNPPNSNEILKLITKDKFIAEDANGAEFITLLSKMLNWTNCIREVKNNTDMKKADGVVYNDKDEPIAIIELKSSDKKISNRDIIAQAFRYKNEKPTCKYVLISNFKQLDIYSDSSDKCYSLDMTLSQNYTTLYALLNQSSLQSNEIARLKKLSLSQDQITKEVYKEYSSFRLKLLNNLIQNNTNISKDDIFECANKLLDRFMFILFAEDRGLIPANSIDTIIKQYENAKDGWEESKPLFYYYKKYFTFIDIGNSKVNIPKYNGNLFKPNEMIESLIIDDEIIKDDLSHLSAYDFSDDVDVEVLGHIFEQSLNDLEKIKESLLSETAHKVVNTRKKDGVFYTPKFVTKYIIDNTVSNLCEAKKQYLKLFDELKNTKKAKEKRREDLHTYREYLESLKIVDPACGSGAFLTACFRYLLNEHKWIQNELLRYEAGLFEHHDVDKQIIENNLFGVDINSASVGIAKLSLWLQTAKRDRPLSNLMGNIKCANSLLSDWNELFPEIMANGGFDVVVGNPPYVRHESIKEFKPALKEKYNIFTGTADLFVYFYELAQNILKANGINGFICSNKFFRAKYGQNLREMILDKTTIKSIVDFNAVKVFEDATVDSTITIFQKGFSEDNIFQVSLNNYDNFFDMSQNDLSKDNFSFVSPKELAIKKKIEKIGTPLKEWDINIYRGILTGFNEAFIIDVAKKDELIKLDDKNKEIIKPLLRGKDIKKYEINFADKWLISTFPSLNLDINNYPIIKDYLKTFGKRLEQIGEKGSRKKTSNKWFETQDQIAYYKEFKKEKIFYNQIGNSLEFYLDKNEFYCNDKLYFITSDELNLTFLIAILNSKILQYYFQMIFNFGGGKGKSTFQNIPIPKLPNYSLYQKNIDYLLNIPEKDIYDKETKYIIGNIDNQDIYTTEFLIAKQLGNIDKFQGHSELVEYLKLIPSLFSQNAFDDVYQNKKDNRKIYTINENSRKIFHIVDENNFLVSVFVVSQVNFDKQLNRRFKHIQNLNGGTATPHILSPARPFWRHSDLIDELYQILDKKSIKEEDFINLVDIIISSKEKIAKYNKHFDSLNAVDKIEIKEEIEKLETEVKNSIEKIDTMVYKLYGLSSDEVRIVEGE